MFIYKGCMLNAFICFMLSTTLAKDTKVIKRGNCNVNDEHEETAPVAVFSIRYISQSSK